MEKVKTEKREDMVDKFVTKFFETKLHKLNFLRKHIK